MSEEIATILERAADRLSKPGAWTQRDNACNDRGITVGARDPSAVCWCALGALLAETADEEMRLAANALRNCIGDGLISRWNDAPGRTQEEVVAKLREAAAKARAAQ